MKSYRGVYYDLLESSYTFTYKDITFYFSSKFYLNKFVSKHLDYLRNENFKMNNYFKCIMEMDNLILIKLYKMIEKRGFRVEINKMEINRDFICFCEVI